MKRGVEWEQIRLKILARDKFKCRYPKCNSIKGINVHHIIPWRVNHDNNSANLITLCDKHHKHEDNHYVQFKQVSMTIRKMIRDGEIE